ncbi:signal peptidase II [bacterium]|nr:MAG: signal peptidase II [bacterium]QQR61489.1 MAG: signal peptidase II [bacterium]QQR62984.1 MAG: signal peptidase II [bacterium]
MRFLNQAVLFLSPIASLILYIVDRLLKLYAYAYLQQTSISVMPFVSYTYALNHGISWGLFEQMPPLILTGLLGMTTLLIFNLARTHQSQVVRTGLTAVWLGSTSNIIDRLIYSGVIDYIELNLASFDFPVFNLADVMIVSGLLYTALQFLMGPTDDARMAR